MTYYVMVYLRAIRGYSGGKRGVPAKLTDDSQWSANKMPVILVGSNFDDYMTPTMVLSVDGSAEARQFAAKGGYKVLDDLESLAEAWGKVILKDRGAAGGRATKGVMTPKKLRAVKKNARLGGRPPLDTQEG